MPIKINIEEQWPPYIFWNDPSEQMSVSGVCYYMIYYNLFRILGTRDRVPVNRVQDFLGGIPPIPSKITILLQIDSLYVYYN